MKYTRFFLTLVLALTAVFASGGRAVKVYKSSFPTHGAMRVLVVPVEYQNLSFVTPDVRDYFDRMLNEEGFDGRGAPGSARDYFKAQSGGRFDVRFDVMPPVRLSQRRSYYGADSGGEAGNDVHADQMVVEALSLLGEEVDFSLYDRDDDGLIDNVFVIYAGLDQAAGAPSEAVWSHAGAVLDNSGLPYLTYGDRMLRDYVCVSELSMSDTPSSTGVFCKELAHTLGLPYLNSTATPLSCTPGAWSLMDSGYLNNGGMTPAGMSSFERCSLGWCEPCVLSGAGSVEMKALSEGGTPCLVPTDRPDEFFLLENRVQSAWDAALPGHGMLVWHIDYDELVWNSAAVNNSSRHQYVDIVEAIGRSDNNSAEAMSAYTYPGTESVISLSLSAWGDGREPLPAITDIREAGAFICFDFGGGASVVPTPASADMEISEQGVLTLSWDAVEGADDYVVDVYIADGSGPALLENYHTGNVTTLRADGLWPDTEYCATVRASSGEHLSETTEEISMLTGDIAMEYRRPHTPEASAADGMAVLSWLPVDDAAAYLLTIESPAAKEPVRITVDFGTGGVFGIPAGWFWNGDVYDASAPAYNGAEAPSVKFASSSHTLVSPFFEEPVAMLSFWLRSAAAAGGSTLRVEGCYDESDDWHPLRDIVMVNEAKNGSTFHIEAGGVRRIRIGYDKEIGNAALDDVVVLTSRTTYAPRPDYTRFDVGVRTEISLEGVFADEGYFFIEAVGHDGSVSLPSRRVFVPAQSGVDVPVAGRADAQAEYYTLQGVRVVKPSRGLYIRRHGSTVTKVFVK